MGRILSIRSEMSDEPKPVCCGCGGEAVVGTVDGVWYAFCDRCDITTSTYQTEAEAVKAWNDAMGTNPRTLMRVFAYDATCGVCDKRKERTAKVKDQHQVGDHGKVYDYGSCGACGAAVILPDKYCSECGAKLDWSEE